jgi:hypothetical protein
VSRLCDRYSYQLKIQGNKLIITASDLPEDLFGLQPALEAIYDELEANASPFEEAVAKKVLDRIWEEQGKVRASEIGSGGNERGSQAAVPKRKGDRAESVRTLVEGRGTVPVSLLIDHGH